jgi:hypothetical protein
MNPTRTLTDHYRTLRESFVAICEGNFQAALLLDYFVSIEHALDEGRSQGESFLQWRSLSISRAGSVMLTQPSKQTIRSSIKTLVDLGFIEGHPGNVMNRGYNHEHSNRFRLCRSAVLHALAAYDAERIQDGGQKQPPMVVKNDHDRWSKMTTMVVKNDHMNQLEEVDESAAAARTPPPPLFDPIQCFQDWAGRLPTSLELKKVVELTTRYGEQDTRAAFEDAALKGGKSLKYVAAILAGDKVPTALVAPVYQAEPEREVISLEERRAMRAAARNGSAS